MTKMQKLEVWCVISMYLSFQCMSGSNLMKKGYPRIISPVDFVTCREHRIVSSPIFRYKRAKCVMGRISPLSTRADSGFLSL